MEQFQRLEANVLALRARERELAKRVELQQQQRTLHDEKMEQRSVSGASARRAHRPDRREASREGD